jgi:hypothetical protein
MYCWRPPHQYQGFHSYPCHCDQILEILIKRFIVLFTIILSSKMLEVASYWAGTDSPGSNIMFSFLRLLFCHMRRPLNQCFSNCGPLRPTDSFGRKRIAKIVWDTERMKNTPIHVCAKTAFVGWPSTESRRLSSCPSVIILENTLK